MSTVRSAPDGLSSIGGWWPQFTIVTSPWSWSSAMIAVTKSSSPASEATTASSLLATSSRSAVPNAAWRKPPST